MDPREFGRMAADILEQSIGATEGLSFPSVPEMPMGTVAPPPVNAMPMPSPQMEPELAPLPLPEAPPNPSFYEQPPVDFMQQQQPPAFMTLDDTIQTPQYGENISETGGALRRPPQFNPNKPIY